MLRLSRFDLPTINKVFDDIERWLRRHDSETIISGMKATYDKSTGKLTLADGKETVTFTKD